jgi:hypothetical protein
MIFILDINLPWKPLLMLLDCIDLFGKLDHQVFPLQIDKLSSLWVKEIRIIWSGEVLIEIVDFEGMEWIQCLLNHLIEFNFIKDDIEAFLELIHPDFAHDALEGLPIMCSHIVVIVVFKEMFLQGVFLVQLF